MNGRLQIPRLGVAVLVLGGACGDEESRPSDQKDSGRDAAGTDRPGGGGGGSNPRAEAGVPSTDDVIDVSEARLEQVARDFCLAAFECDSEMATAQLQDDTYCLEFISSAIQGDMDADGDACGDALLDTYDCYAATSCEEDSYEVCAAQIEATVEHCPNSPRNAE